MDEASKTLRKQTLRVLSQTIWRVIQETPGVGALAASLETDYDDLPKAKRVTIAMVIDVYEKTREEVITGAIKEAKAAAFKKAGKEAAKEEASDDDESPEVVAEIVDR